MSLESDLREIASILLKCKNCKSSRLSPCDQNCNVTCRICCTTFNIYELTMDCWKQHDKKAEADDE